VLGLLARLLFLHGSQSHEYAVERLHASTFRLFQDVRINIQEA
jgi:hypothetical protein